MTRINSLIKEAGDVSRNLARFFLTAALLGTLFLLLDYKEVSFAVETNVFIWEIPLKQELRLLILGDSNDGYIATAICCRETNASVTKSNHTKVFMASFNAFKLLQFQVDGSNSSQQVELALDLFFSSTAHAASQALGGPPNAVLLQSLFHDLEWTFWTSPSFIHGMAASDDIWSEWLARWSSVASLSVQAALRHFQQATWLGWRGSNQVWQGDHDGWLLVAPRIVSANTEAARMAQRMGIEFADFDCFSKLSDLSDYVHQKRQVHRAFILELLKNLTDLAPKSKIS